MTTSFRQTLTERSRERETRRRRIVSYFWAVYLLVAVPTFLYIFLHPIWFIKEVRVEGNYSLSASLLSETVSEHLSGHSFYVIPRQSFFFVSKKKIARDLVEHYPRIYRVRVSIEGLNTLVVRVDERRPALIGCPLNQASSSSCFYLDQTGVIFEPSPRFSPGVFPTIVSSLITPANVNHQVLTPEEVVDLPRFLKDVEVIVDTELATDFLVGDTTILAQGDTFTSFHRREDQAKSWEFRFNRRHDLVKAIFYFNSAITNEAFQTDWLKAPDALEYIDARFGKKIFYRFSTYATTTPITN